MGPYVITSAVLITYDGKKIPLENIESEIMTRPIQLTKERILDAFSMMKDKPVDVELKIKYMKKKKRVYYNHNRDGHIYRRLSR